MEIKINLTTNEIAILKECLNAKTREGQLSDNFSNGGMVEFVEALPNVSRKGIGGVISSLEKKGLAFMDHEHGGDPSIGGILWMTEKDVNALFDIIETEGN